MTSAPPAEQWRRRDARVSASRALASSTRASIYEHLRDGEEPRTVRDVADLFDLHPNVARTHLEMLADAGLLVVGRRKHPGGGRPAKVYRAGSGNDRESALAPVGDQVAARLQIRLLTELLDGDGDREVETRAFQGAAAEGRRLAEPLTTEESESLKEAADVAVRAVLPHAPDTRLIKAEDDWVDIAGISSAFDLVAAARPALAEAFQRGLLDGAFAAAGHRIAVTSAGALKDGGRVWRVRQASGGSGARPGPAAARRVDARGMPREQGVVRAVREITGLRTGQVLEVLAEGPGAPATFARWVDRAGHELLGVERATDEGKRSAIRLMIRKGRG